MFRPCKTSRILQLELSKDCRDLLGSSRAISRVALTQVSIAISCLYSDIRLQEPQTILTKETIKMTHLLFPFRVYKEKQKSLNSMHFRVGSTNTQTVSMSVIKYLNVHYNNFFTKLSTTFLSNNWEANVFLKE